MSTKGVWLITGCSSGFGAALANEALSRGFAVIATARNPSKLGDLKAAGATTLALDVTKPLPELEAIAEEVVKVHGRIDFLINNAGYAQVGGLEEISPGETQAQFNTNIFGVLNVNRAFFPYMRKARSGVVANISSVGAWHGAAGAGLYCATKWCLSGLSETMTLEMKEFGIKVLTSLSSCCVEPGYFRSNFLGGDAKSVISNPISDYDGSAVRKGEEMLVWYNGKQPGDVNKGVRLIVDTLTEKNGKEVPVRLILGSDCWQSVKAKCEETLKLLEGQKERSCGTDLDDKSY